MWITLVVVSAMCCLVLGVMATHSGRRPPVDPPGDPHDDGVVAPAPAPDPAPGASGHLGAGGGHRHGAAGDDDTDGDWDVV